MLLYEYQVRDEFERVRELARRLKEKFDSRASAADLMLDTRTLGAAYDQLDRMLPTEVQRGNFGRHLHFLELFLERGETDRCSADAQDIIAIDLPWLEQGFRQWATSLQHYDPEFANEIAPLLRDRHLDSAVRKAFVILKARLIARFGTPLDLDGRDLVNSVFGGRGLLAGQMPDSDRESMRNLLDGMYGIFRNRYGHQDVNPEWSEVDAILAMVNWGLKQIELLPREPQ